MTEDSIDLDEALAWDEFERVLRGENRHAPLDREYFRTLITECLACTYELASGTRLFRARINPPARGGEPLALAEMGAPPATSATSQRLNPEGIPYFYAALDEKTAIAEVRPWTGAWVTVAQFKTRYSLPIVDLTAQHSTPSPRAQFVGFIIGYPVHRDDRLAYVGSQSLAEHLKAAGRAGIQYRSSLRGNGTNIALFSQDHVLAAGTPVPHKVLSVSYETIDVPEED